MEVIEPFTKGSTVEVSSEEDGLYGAWYVATLVDIIDDVSPTKKARSSTKKKKKKNTRDKNKVGYLVKYDTLFQENDHTEPLTEIVDPLYVRPLPPRNGDHGCGEFEVCDVVDAYLNDGWWVGVVKKVNVVEGEMMMMRKYVVEFESPPEEVEFVGSEMRLHLDWVDSTWKVRSQKTPNQESITKIATHTSDSNNESNNGANSDFITPTKKALKTDSAYLTGLSAKRRSQLPKKALSNADTIRELKGSAKFRRRRRVVNVDDDEEELHENFKSSAGVENSGSKGNTEVMVSMMETSAAKAKAKDQDSLLLEQETIIKETSETRDGNNQLKRKRGSPSKSSSLTSNASLEESKGNTEVMVSMMVTSAAKAKAKDQDSLLLEQETIIKKTSETRDGNNQLKRKRGRPSKSSSSLTPNASLEDDQEAGKMGSSGIYEITNELDEQPLAVWYKGLHPLPVSKKNSCNTTLDHGEPIAASNPTMVNDGQTTENNQILPFVKQSPIWAAIESLEVYQNLSQNPHFSPLWKNKEDCREGLAIAHMITFANLVQRTTNLQWTDPNHIITNSLESLVDLEDNGFDVGPVRVRLDELLAKKDEVSRLDGEMKETEKEVEKCNREKMAIVEEINGLERKMEELEEMMVKAVAMKNGKDEEVKVVRSKLQVFLKRIADWKLAFEELVGHPL